MEITKVKVRLVHDKPRLKGLASITFDGALTINDIKIIQTETRLCAEFPKHQFAKNNHLEYVVPLNQEIRSMIERMILQEYDAVVIRNSVPLQKQVG